MHFKASQALRAGKPATILQKAWLAYAWHHHYRTGLEDLQRHFLLRYDKKLSPIRFVHHHLTYLSGFESFPARL